MLSLAMKLGLVTPMVFGHVAPAPVQPVPTLVVPAPVAATPAPEPTPVTTSAPVVYSPAPAPVVTVAYCTASWTTHGPWQSPYQPTVPPAPPESGAGQGDCDAVQQEVANLPSGSTYGMVQGLVDPTTIVQDVTVP